MVGRFVIILLKLLLVNLLLTLLLLLILQLGLHIQVNKNVSNALISNLLLASSRSFSDGNC